MQLTRPNIKLIVVHMTSQPLHSLYPRLWMVPTLQQLSLLPSALVYLFYID